MGRIWGGAYYPGRAYFQGNMVDTVFLQKSLNPGLISSSQITSIAKLLSFSGICFWWLVGSKLLLFYRSKRDTSSFCIQCIRLLFAMLFFPNCFFKTASSTSKKWLFQNKISRFSWVLSQHRREMSTCQERIPLPSCVCSAPSGF